MNTRKINQLEKRVVSALKKERLRQQLSAAALAGKIKVSRAAITHMEAGRCSPTLKMVLKIAAGLRLELGSLLPA